MVVQASARFSKYIQRHAWNISEITWPTLDGLTISTVSKVSVGSVRYYGHQL